MMVTIIIRARGLEFMMRLRDRDWASAKGVGSRVRVRIQRGDPVAG